jgi:hypothetical protein
MAKQFEDIIVESKLDIPYSYYAGPIASRFYDAIEKERKILGIRCSSCNRVYMPPRPTCGSCFKEMSEWVELKDEGQVVNYTIVHYADPIQPVKPPFAYGLIQLDGADTAFIHLLGEVQLNSIRIGMRVKAVFSDKNPGNILDIDHFRPV